jgi:hypothetical protein
MQGFREPVLRSTITETRGTRRDFKVTLSQSSPCCVSPFSSAKKALGEGGDEAELDEQAQDGF